MLTTAGSHLGSVNNSSLSPPFRIPHLSIIGSPRRCAQWHLAAKHPTISYHLPWRLKLIHVSSMDLDGINGHTMAYWRPLLLRPQRQYWIQGRCHFFTLPFTMLCQMQGDAWSGLGYCGHHSGNWLGILRSVFFQIQRRPHDVIFNILRALLLWQKTDSLDGGHKIIKKRSELIIREHIWHIPASLDFMLPHAAISLLVASHFAWWLWWIWVVCRSRFSSLAIARTVCKGLQAANFRICDKRSSSIHIQKLPPCSIPADVNSSASDFGNWICFCILRPSHPKLSEDQGLCWLGGTIGWSGRSHLLRKLSKKLCLRVCEQIPDVKSISIYTIINYELLIIVV